MLQKLAIQLFRRVSPDSAIFVSLIVMAGSIAAFVAFFAATHDADQVAIEKTIVQSVVHDALAKLGDALRPNTYWDDGFDHITNTVDKDWAQKNLGPYANSTSNVSALFVVSENDRAIYEYVTPALGAAPQQFEQDAAFKALVAEARQHPSAPPFIATGFVEVGGRIYLGAASLLVPNDDRAGKPLARRNVELYLQSFDSEKLSKLQKDFKLSHIALSSRLAAYKSAHVAIADASGAIVAHLSWDTSAPGTAFAIFLIPVAITSLLVVGLLLWMALKSWSFTVTALETEKLEAEQARSEELLHSAEKAQEASAAKSAFLAMMSHEIRTPMNGVLGMVGVLLDGDLSRDQRRHAQTIRESAETLLRIINDILDFSKLEAGKLDIEIAPFALHELLEQVCKTIQPRAEAKGIALDLHYSVPEFVRSDSGRIRQILLNLIANAVKFTERGGVTVRATSRTDEAGQPILRLSISDTGIGMSAEQQKLLFQSFSQTDASISRRFGGTGLGLAISKQLVERLGGEVGCESELGHGSTFWFSLPVVIASAEEVAAREHEQGGQEAAEACEYLKLLGPRLRVLLVEDNATNIVVAKAVLGKFGIEPDVAENGLQAINAVKSAPYDVILMDVHMPEMDGLEATEAIRAMAGPAGETPIVGLSANAFAEDIARGRSAGMNHHLAKPFKTEELAVALVRAVCGSDADAVSEEEQETELAPEVLDWRVIETFRAQCGDETLAKMIGTFLPDAGKNLDELQKRMQTGELREAARIAHSLKSSSAMVGAAILSTMAAQMEASFGIGRKVEPSSLAEMRDAFQQYRAKLVERGLAA